MNIGKGSAIKEQAVLLIMHSGHGKSSARMMGAYLHILT